MGNPSWSQKISESIKHHVGKDVCDEIMNGSEILEELDETSKAKWVKEAMDKFDGLIRDQDTKIKIMTDCSCECYEEHLDYLKDVYKKSGDIDELLDAMYGKVFLLKPVREGNIVYITKAPRFPEEHGAASTPEEKRYYFCHCDNVRASTEWISPTYCYCGAGWCKKIWEGILGKPVRVDIMKSVLQGDEVCQFAVYLGDT
jgi:hypothetical protein